MATGKKLRFEVFKRDSFQCVYCGRTPPEVVLECDHISPRSKGGETEINNLITACFDCNRGKRDIPLDKIPSSMADNLEVLREKELQIAEYNKFIRRIERRLSKSIKEVDEVYTSWFNKWCLSDKFKQASLKRFLKNLPLQFVKDAMHTACSKMGDEDQAIRYFCGICWNKIKSKGRPDEQEK